MPGPSRSRAERRRRCAARRRSRGAARSRFRAAAGELPTAWTKPSISSTREPAGRTLPPGRAARRRRSGRRLLSCRCALTRACRRLRPRGRGGRGGGPACRRRDAACGHATGAGPRATGEAPRLPRRLACRRAAGASPANARTHAAPSGVPPRRRPPGPLRRPGRRGIEPNGENQTRSSAGAKRRRQLTRPPRASGSARPSGSASAGRSTPQRPHGREVRLLRNVGAH